MTSMPAGAACATRMRKFCGARFVEKLDAVLRRETQTTFCTSFRKFYRTLRCSMHKTEDALKNTGQVVKMKISDVKNSDTFQSFSAKFTSTAANVKVRFAALLLSLFSCLSSALGHFCELKQFSRLSMLSPFCVACSSRLFFQFHYPTNSIILAVEDRHLDVDVRWFSVDNTHRRCRAGERAAAEVRAQHDEHAVHSHRSHSNDQRWDFSISV